MNRSKYRIAIVNYINTWPFIKGLSDPSIKNQIELIECSPAKCAAYFEEGSVDISLVPTGALIDKEYTIISDFGIASDGPVASVCLLANNPVDKLEKVYLDYQSRTSVLLVQLLFKNYWKKEIQFIDALPGFETDPYDLNTGILVIGDRALELKSTFRYNYDLGQEWKNYASLPFVYAAWVCHPPISDAFLDLFNKALLLGVESIQCNRWPEPKVSIRLEEYFTKNIKYWLDDTYFLGMQKFISESTDILSASNAL